jgi:hypothetical protein
VKRGARWIGLAAVAVAVTVAGYLVRHNDEYLPPDQWHRLPPSDFFHSARAKERDPATFAVVLPQLEPGSLARLKESAWVEVSEKEAADLAGRTLGGADGRLVLLRALAWDTPHGEFAVRWRPGEVFVQHGCLGTRPLPVVRPAVVARLPDLPSEAYVGLEMAD